MFKKIKENTKEIKRITELEMNKERDDRLIELQDMVIRLQQDLIKKQEELLVYREEKIRKIKEKRNNVGKEIYKKTN